MIGLLRAEVRKLTSVRTTTVLSLVGWALVAISGFFLLFSRFDDETGMPIFGAAGSFTGTEQQVADAIDQIGGSAILVLVVGVLLVTTEIRHQTIGRTLQLTPSRTRVLLSKLVAGVGYALAFFLGGLAVVATLLALAAAIAGVGITGGALVTTAVWHGVVGFALTAMLGVAVGALLRSQVVAVTVSLVWVFVVETLVSQFAPAVGRFLPFQAQQAIFVSEEVRASAPPGFPELLDPAVGLVVFLAYVTAATVVAGILLRTRDV